MRTYEISSPGAAELYFNNSIVGSVFTLLAESLGGARARRQPIHGAGRVPAGNPPAESAEVWRKPWLDRLDAWFWEQRQKDMESYLAGSADVFELERRIETLQRGSITPYY